jgi:hypothetical protein
MKYYKCEAPSTLMLASLSYMDFFNIGEALLMSHDIVTIIPVVKEMALPDYGNVTLVLFFFFSCSVFKRAASNHCR